MGEIGLRGGKLLRSSALIAVAVLLYSVLVSAKWSSKLEISSTENGISEDFDSNYFLRILNFLWRQSRLGYQHVWPEMKFGWRIIVGTVIGFFGAAFGSVGGVGGGGIFVPMLTLVIGFDAKSSTAMSKCMITGAAVASVYYNIKLRHPTLDLPLIDYDLALLFQPMLVLGISIGVAFNVIFADWMITVLLIVFFLGTSTKAFFRGVETWKKETIIKKEAARRLAPTGFDSEEVEYKPLPEGPSNGAQTESNALKASEVSIVENVHWKELGILVAVWVIILSLQIAKALGLFGWWICAGNVKDKTTTCSVAYWVLNLLQIPVAFGASAYEAIGLYKGRRVIASTGEAGKAWQVHQLVLYCSCGILAGVVGGLLGLGGGFILGPLFLELGVPPQIGCSAANATFGLRGLLFPVSSATATFAMMFSASMSVVEYYLLNRFPVPYSLYFVAVASVAAFTGQYVVTRVIAILGRASLIIFILAFTIFLSAILLGGVGISNMITEIKEKEYMGFDDICSY